MTATYRNAARYSCLKALINSKSILIFAKLIFSLTAHQSNYVWAYCKHTIVKQGCSRLKKKKYCSLVYSLSFEWYFHFLSTVVFPSYFLVTTYLFSGLVSVWMKFHFQMSLLVQKVNKMWNDSCWWSSLISHSSDGAQILHIDVLSCLPFGTKDLTSSDLLCCSLVLDTKDKMFG